MDTNETDLDTVRRDAGHELLRLTDNVGFGAVGAAWIRNADSGRWHYLLITPMLDSKGPRWLYERLVQVFSKMPLPEGITPLDITIGSPQEVAYHRFPIHAGRPGDSTTVSTISGLTVNGYTIDKMMVYRMLPPTERQANRGGDRARIFDSKVRELLAA